MSDNECDKIKVVTAIQKLLVAVLLAQVGLGGVAWVKDAQYQKAGYETLSTMREALVEVKSASKTVQTIAQANHVSTREYVARIEADVDKLKDEVAMLKTQAVFPFAILEHD